MSEAN